MGITLDNIFTDPLSTLIVEGERRKIMMERFLDQCYLRGIEDDLTLDFGQGGDQ